MAHDIARRGCFNRDLAHALARQVGQEEETSTEEDLPMTATALEDIGRPVLRQVATATLEREEVAAPSEPITVTGLSSLSPADQQRFGQLEAIFFDVDDTLIYSEPDIVTAFTNACLQVGLHVNRATVAHGLKEVAWPRFVKEGLRFADDQPGMIRFFISMLLPELGVPEAQRAQLAEQIYTYVTQTIKSKTYPDAVLALRALHNQGLGIAAITGRLHSTEDVLTELGIRKFFDFYMYAGQHRVGKLTPRFYEHALAVLELDADQVAVIDDEPTALRVAQELGCMTFLIDRDSRKAKEQDTGGLYRLDRLDRLNDLLAAARLRF